MSSNIHLILLPVALDFLLWFGPHLRMKALVEPFVLELIKFVRLSSPSEMRSVWDGMETLWQTFLDQFNLVSALSTFPIGVPTLMVSQTPLQTPIGDAPLYEMSSPVGVALAWLGLSIAGLGLATIYYAWVTHGCARLQANIACDDSSLPRKFSGQIPPFRLHVLAWQGLQVLAIILFLALLAIVIVLPAVFLASLLALISPLLAQAALIFLTFSGMWFLMPLVFSPHGIFLCGFSVINAMISSARVVRYSLSGTGLFLVSVIVLNQGLGILWRFPAEDSWLALVGIFGHAFIATALLAASFIYYRSGLAYVQGLRNLSLSRRGLS